MKYIGAVRVAMAVSLTFALLAGPALAAEPIDLGHAHRIALRWAYRTSTDVVTRTTVSGCRSGARRDYAICTARFEDAGNPAEGDNGGYQELPVVVWRLAHGYAIRMQEPALERPNAVWRTR